jgi:hypothetical protein
VSSSKKRCGIPAHTLPPCDLEWGHLGDMHSSGGDGFYAVDYDGVHEQRQQEAAATRLTYQEWLAKAPVRLNSSNDGIEPVWCHDGIVWVNDQASVERFIRTFEPVVAWLKEKP